MPEARSKKVTVSDSDSEDIFANTPSNEEYSKKISLDTKFREKEFVLDRSLELKITRTTEQLDKLYKIYIQTSDLEVERKALRLIDKLEKKLEQYEDARLRPSKEESREAVGYRRNDSSRHYAARNSVDNYETSNRIPIKRASAKEQDPLPPISDAPYRSLGSPDVTVPRASTQNDYIEPSYGPKKVVRLEVLNQTDRANSITITIPPSLSLSGEATQVTYYMADGSMWDKGLSERRLNDAGIRIIREAGSVMRFEFDREGTFSISGTDIKAQRIVVGESAKAENDSLIKQREPVNALGALSYIPPYGQSLDSLRSIEITLNKEKIRFDPSVFKTNNQEPVHFDNGISVFPNPENPNAVIIRAYRPGIFELSAWSRDNASLTPRGPIRYQIRAKNRETI